MVFQQYQAHSQPCGEGGLVSSRCTSVPCRGCMCKSMQSTFCHIVSYWEELSYQLHTLHCRHCFLLLGTHNLQPIDMPSICSSYMITGELHLGCYVETLKPWLAGYIEAWLSKP